MSFVNGFFGDLQRVGQGGCSFARQPASPTFESSEDLPRNAGPLGELRLRETGHAAQISEGLFGFRDCQEVLRQQSHRRGGQAQGVHQW